MEFVDFDVKIFDGYIEIIPKDSIKKNSIYNIKISNVSSTDGKKLDNDIDIKYKSMLYPMYCLVEDIEALIEIVTVSKDIIMRQIKEASLYARYVSGGTVSDEDVPFEVRELTKNRAARICLMKIYSEKAGMQNEKGQIGDVNYSTTIDAKEYEKLIKLFSGEEDKWTDEITNSGKAQLKIITRGKKGYTPINYSMNRREP